MELYGETPINFRTTFATMAVASGVDIRTMQSLMGHSTPEVREAGPEPARIVMITKT